MYGTVTTSARYNFPDYDVTGYIPHTIPSFFPYNTSTNIGYYEDWSSPRPRNRREKRIETSVGDRAGRTWDKLIAQFEKEGVRAREREKLNHAFWQRL